MDQKIELFVKLAHFFVTLGQHPPFFLEEMIKNDLENLKEKLIHERGLKSDDVNVPFSFSFVPFFLFLPSFLFVSVCPFFFYLFY